MLICTISDLTRICNLLHFFKWNNKKHVVSTLEAMQEVIEIHHNKGIDMLKLGCTIPHLANTFFTKISRFKNSTFYRNGQRFGGQNKRKNG